MIRLVREINDEDELRIAVEDEFADLIMESWGEDN